jgi:hypothetical protein
MKRKMPGVQIARQYNDYDYDEYPSTAQRRNSPA